MNSDEFSTPSRRAFVKRSAFSAIATTFAYSAPAILTSCQAPSGPLPIPPGWGSGAWSSQNVLTVQETEGGAIITNTSDHPVTVTGLPGGATVTIQPGESVFVEIQD